jgi:hypothetical protein
MLRRCLILIALLFVVIPACLAADENEIPLGDIARALRREKEQRDKHEPERRVIDNENLDQLMNELQSKRFSSTTLLFSMDGGDKGFKVSTPDVSCNLSFNAKTTSLLTDPFMPRPVPRGVIAKLDGPAMIQDNTLQVSVYNGSDWNIKELIVGLTMLRTPTPKIYGPFMLKPAAETVVETAEKRPDQTVIYHLRGNAAPQSTTVFTTELTTEPDPEQEWHWAIVGAKGVPADLSTIPEPGTTPETTSPTSVPAVPTAEPVPATSTNNPHP